MATDLAEFLGAALGFYLLFGVPLWTAGAPHRGRHLPDPQPRALRVPAAGSGDHRPRGRDRGELPRRDDPGPAAPGPGPLPRRRAAASQGPKASSCSAGILGATVMPHAIYLHSALTQGRIVVRDAGKAAAALPVRGAGRRDRHGHRRADQHGHAHHGRCHLSRTGHDLGRLDRGGAPAPSSRSWAGRRAGCSPSPCSPRACPRRPSAPWPGRSSWQGFLQAAGPRRGSGGSRRWSRRSS